MVKKENLRIQYLHLHGQNIHLSLINYCEIGIYLSFISLQIFFTRRIVKYLRVEETVPEKTQFFTPLQTLQFSFTYSLHCEA